MANSKFILAGVSYLLTTGCSEPSLPHFFSDIGTDRDNKIQYQDIHRLSLSLVTLKKTIDETGFNPVLNCYLRLENENQGPWNQAWVAFNINVFVSKHKVASIKRAGILQNHAMEVDIQQDLPRFGLKSKDIKIEITPVAWMPSYPLQIQSSDQTATPTNPITVY
ncbi:MAG: hypothetical protein HWE18_07105 [Gammaproteobacteria bacterium]|nr:hypothetical protein [Gammaproteobacteria bacterium]